MMSTRLAWACGAVLAGTMACSAAPDERRVNVEQRLDITPEGAACSHAICATGEALEAACDPCAVSLCAQDPYCCSTAWDATCVGEVGSICGNSCIAVPPVETEAGPSTCAHPLCATGEALESTCDACAVSLCAQDPYCCSTAWDATCVGEVGSICGQACN